MGHTLPRRINRPISYYSSPGPVSRLPAHGTLSFGRTTSEPRPGQDRPTGREGRAKLIVTHTKGGGGGVSGTQRTTQSKTSATHIYLQKQCWTNVNIDSPPRKQDAFYDTFPSKLKSTFPKTAAAPCLSLSLSLAPSLLPCGLPGLSPLPHLNQRNKALLNLESLQLL